MNTTQQEVRKLNFLDIFEPSFNREKISVGIHEKVILTIRYPEAFTLDQDVFTAIWTHGEKISLEKTIASTVFAESFNSVGLTSEDDLQESLYRLSNIGIQIMVSNTTEQREINHNLFDMASEFDVDGNLIAVTMSVRNPEIFNWLFVEDLMNLSEEGC